jgi:autotransporter-associated beta strand protein
MKSSRFNRFVSCVSVAFSLAFTVSSFAATGTWSATTGGNWEDATTAPWTSGTVAGGATFTANFTSDITADTTVTLTANRTIGNITFNDTGATADSGWILDASGGSLLTLDNGASQAVITKTSGATINALLAGSNIRINGSGGVTLTGNNTGITGNVALNGVNGVSLSNANALGSALVTFTNNEVLGGTTTGITIANNFAFSGGVSWYAGTNGLKTTGSVTLSGANQGFNGWFAASNTEWAGAVNLGTNKLNVTSAVATGGLVISGTLSGTNGLTKTGANTLTLSGNNASFSGATSITGGTLALDYTTNNTAKLGNGAVTLGGGATLRFKGNASATTTETNSGGLTIAGGGAIYLDTASGQTLTADFSGGSFTSSNGGLYVGTTGSGTGQLRLGSTTASTALIKNIVVGSVFGATDASNFIVGSTASTLTGASDLSTWTSGTKQYTSGGSAFTSSVGAGVSIDGITFNEAAARTVTIGTGNTLTLSNGIIVTPDVANNASLITGGSLSTPSGGVLNVFNADTQNALTITSGITNNGGTSLVKNGAGRLILNGTNTYNGGTTVNAGTLELSGGGNFNNPFGNAGGGALTMNPGTVLTASAVHVLGPVRPITIDGATLNVNAINYANNITLKNGATLTGAGENYRAGYFGDATVTVSGTSASTISGNVTLAKNGTADTLTVDVADVTSSTAADLTVSGVIQDLGGFTGAALVKSGAGTMAISSRATFVGGTTINTNGGTIDITGLSGGTAGQGGLRGTITVNSGGTLRLSTGDATGYNTDGTRLSVINLVGGSLNVNTTSNQTLGSATINMTGGSITGIANSNLDIFAGSSAINTLASATSSTIDTVKLSIRQTGGLTLTVADGAAASDLSISSVIASNGSFTAAPLIKAGAGTLTLTGANTYTGATNINAGALAVNGTLANTTTTVTSTTSARLRGSGSIAGSVSIGDKGTIGAGNSIESLGVGSLALTGGSTFEHETLDNTGLGADLVFSAGDLSLAGTVTLSLLDTGSYVWQVNDKLTLISYLGSLTANSLFSYAGGDFNSDGKLQDDETFTFDGAQWVFNYNDTLEGSNYTGDSAGTYVTMTVIPEPRAALLGGLGLLALLRRRR